MLRGRGACIRLIRLIRLIFNDEGAPVFALTGYAVASHVIPEGGAVPRCGMARAPGNVMATAVCVLRGRDACIRLIRLIRPMQ